MPDDRCRSCGAKIIWARTKKGRRIPLDPQPTGKGNLHLDRAVSPPIATSVVPYGDERDATLYITHFATCPNAKKHRKSRRQPQEER